MKIKPNRYVQQHVIKRNEKETEDDRKARLAAEQRIHRQRRNRRKRELRDAKLSRSR